MRGKVRFAVAGVLVAGMFAIAQAQPGGGFGRGGGGPVGLINNKAVQEELKLSEETVKKLGDWGKEFRQKSAEIMKDKGVVFDKGSFGKGGLSPEMQEKMAAANAEISKVAYKELGDVLTKEQLTRLKQIERQQLGLRAFTNAEVVDTLKLTDAQKTSIMGINGDFTKDTADLRPKFSKDTKFDLAQFQENQKKIAKVEKEFIGKAVDLLDDTQKKTWKELIGEPFDLSKLQPMFGKKQKD